MAHAGVYNIFDASQAVGMFKCKCICNRTAAEKQETVIQTMELVIRFNNCFSLYFSCPY